MKLNNATQNLLKVTAALGLLSAMGLIGNFAYTYIDKKNSERNERENARINATATKFESNTTTAEHNQREVEKLCGKNPAVAHKQLSFEEEMKTLFRKINQQICRVGKDGKPFMSQEEIKRKIERLKTAPETEQQKILSDCRLRVNNLEEYVTVIIALNEIAQKKDMPSFEENDVIDFFESKTDKQETTLLTLRLAPEKILFQKSADFAAKKGRNLFTSLTMVNTEREVNGLDGIWPRTVDPSSNDKTDINGKTFKSSSEFFATLFDTPNVGKNTWKPYLKDIDINVTNLSGDKKSCDWLIAANIDCAHSDNTPFLVSSNVDPQMLNRFLKDGVSDEPLAFGSKVDRKSLPWCDECVVVVRKGGKAHVIKARFVTSKSILGDDCPQNLVFLDVK